MAFEPKRISELELIPSIDSGDLFPIVDVSDTAAGTTKKTTINQIVAAISTIGINASAITSGLISDARLSGNVTLQGNSFNNLNELVKLDSSTRLPPVNGVFLTNLNGSNITSGTIPNSRLSSSVTLQGNTFNGINQLVQLNASAQLPPLNGSLLTSLNASELTSGTLPDARLSTNVMFKGKIITTIGSAGNTVLTNAMTDGWFVTSHSSGIVTFTLADSPINTPQAYFRILTNSTSDVHIVTGPSTTVYYFMGTINPGSSFTPPPQRGRVIDIYCIATNTFIMTGDLM